MEIGVRIPHTGPHASPEKIRAWCQTADDAGFGSLWGVDHVVMPRYVESKYDLPRKPAAIAEDAVAERLRPNFELITTMAYVAALTRRIKIGSSIAILSIRNAVLNARQLATIDRYSGGRVVCGVGVGWLKEEAAAMNMPWDRRGARAEEHIALMREIWTATAAHVEFHGEFWDIPPMDPEPRPVQQPIPVLIGGHSAAAVDRAARIGDGWIAADMSPERLADYLPGFAEAALRNGRAPGSLSVSCSAIEKYSNLDSIRRYAELGVTSLHVTIATLDDLKRFGDQVLPQVP